MKIAIIGGGIQGVHIAKEAAAAGHEVWLIEHRQYLGYEVTANEHGWLYNTRYEIGIPIGAIRKLPLSHCIDNGIHLLLGSHIGGLVIGNKRCCGVVIANSWGTQILNTDIVIDTLGTLYMLPFDGKQLVHVNYAFMVGGVSAPLKWEATVPEEFELENNRISFHKNIRPNTLTVSFRYAEKMTFAEYVQSEHQSVKARQKATVLTAYLRQLPGMSGAKIIGTMDNEVWYDESNLLQTKTPDGYYLMCSVSTDQITIGDTLEKFVMNGGQLRAILRLPAKTAKPDSIIINGISISLLSCTFHEQNGLPTGLRAVQIPTEKLPVLPSESVIVAGAGTSGITACEALSEKQIPFTVVEPNELSGGTHTLGGVCSYWHGYQGGINTILDESAMQIKNSLPLSSLAQAKTLLHDRILGNALPMSYFGTCVCGSEVKTDVNGNKKVTGLVCCQKRGLFLLRAEHIIDASGDGVVAYLSGAEYEVGDRRDGSVQSYSLWGESDMNVGGWMDNPYKGDHDIINPDSYADFLRGSILAQMDNSDLTYSPMLTVRESRRIIGDYVLNMSDLRNGRIFEDTVAVSDTPFDTHGWQSSLFENPCWRSGKSYRARIPYRSYLVKGFENLIITAKAFSATRDANSVCRMNPDLRNAGYAVGLAVAESVKAGCGLRDIDLSKVQTELMEKACLPGWTFIRDAELSDTEAEAEKYIQSGTDSIDTEAVSQEAKMLLSCMKNENTADCETEGSDDSITGFYKKICRDMTLLCLSDNTKPEQIKPLIPFCNAGGEAIYYRTPKYRDTLYGYQRCDCWKTPHYELLHILAETVERHADTSLIAAMDDLLSQPHITGYLTVNNTTDSEIVCHSIAPAFLSLLEVRLYAAAARCGSKKGIEGLIRFTADDREIIRRFVKKELSEIVGSYETVDLSAYILKAVPYIGKPELV